MYSDDDFDVTPYTGDLLEMRLSGSRRTDYMKQYLSDQGATVILCENDYVDTDFLTDYCSYYARCFARQDRQCKRLHFFRGVTDDVVAKAVLDRDQAFWRDVAYGSPRKYLGFIVMRPFGILGRTLLQTYDPVDRDGKRRYFPAAIANHPRSPNLFGVRLPVDSLEYQEQDGAVCACATVALWCAARKLQSLFGFPRSYSPSEITQIACDVFPHPGRSYPSGGLNIYQIVGFLKKEGLEVEYLRTSDLDASGRAEHLLTLVHAYLRFGIPIICGLELKKAGAADQYHAVTMVGYKTPSDWGPGNRALSIGEFYVHDDQVGPFSRVNFASSTPWIWQNHWTETGEADECRLVHVLLPILPEVRQGIDSLYFEMKKPLAQQLLKDAASFEIFLVDVADYKSELYLASKLTADDVLRRNLPRRLWVVRLYFPNGTRSDTLFDATDHAPVQVYPGPVLFEK
jgi:hypothetical protein